MILNFMFYWVFYFILKLVYLVVVNVVYYRDFDKVNLFIIKVEVSRSIIMKKFRLWVWGCSFFIKKSMCYIIIVLNIVKRFK